MGPSDKAYELIKHFEGLRLRSYVDLAGIYTIGYGHTNRVGPGMVIDQDEAERLLEDDVADATYELNKMLNVIVKQHEFDALVSWVFNIGSAKTAKSTLIRKLNAGEPKVSQQLLRWCKARDPRTGILTESPGLKRRRMAEKKLYDTGIVNFGEV